MCENPDEASKVRTIFSKAQHSDFSHTNLLKQLKNLYDNLPNRIFSKEFKHCLKVPFMHREKVPPVQRTMQFAVKFCVSFNDQMPPFLLKVFKFLLKNIGFHNPTVRFRICQFIGNYFNSLEDSAAFDCSFSDNLIDSLLQRLKDTNSDVRAQAVQALWRFQEPNADGAVSKAFLFHLGHDPSSGVRLAIIRSLLLYSGNAAAIFERTLDVDEKVRRTAYVRLAEVDLQLIPIEQRSLLIKRGLDDPSETVRKSGLTHLLVSWLESLNGSFISYLEALDSQQSSKICSFSLLLLFKYDKTALPSAVDEFLTLQGPAKLVPIEKLSCTNVFLWKVVVAYIQYLEADEDNSFEEPIENVLPELSTFCGYIQRFVDDVGTVENVSKEKRKYILKTLLEMTKRFDLADETGRSNLTSLCQKLLVNDQVSNQVIPCLVDVLVQTMPDNESRLQMLAELISEYQDPLAESSQSQTQRSVEEDRQLEIKEAKIRLMLNKLTEKQELATKAKDFRRVLLLQEECALLQDELVALKNQPCALLKSPSKKSLNKKPENKRKLLRSLYIAREMMQSPRVVSLSPTLRSLMDCLVLPSLKLVKELEIRNVALEAMGSFCVLDRTLAKHHFMLFVVQIAHDDVSETALKVIFDILQTFGFETFDGKGRNSKEKNAGRRTGTSKGTLENNQCERGKADNPNTFSRETEQLLNILTSIAQNNTKVMRNVAIGGLSKLLVSGRIKSPSYLSRFLLIWLKHENDGTDVGVRMEDFLMALSSCCARGQEMLNQAFLPTMRTIIQETDENGMLMSLDPISLADKCFISVTNPKMECLYKKQDNNNAHNAMAESLCQEILNRENVHRATRDEILLKCLLKLELSLEDSTSRDKLLEYAAIMKKLFRWETEMALVKDFQIKVLDLRDPESSPQDTTCPEIINTLREDEFIEFSCNSPPKKSRKNAKILQRVDDAFEGDKQESNACLDLSPLKEVMHKTVVAESSCSSLSFGEVSQSCQESSSKDCEQLTSDNELSENIPTRKELSEDFVSSGERQEESHRSINTVDSQIREADSTTSEHIVTMEEPC